MSICVKINKEEIYRDHFEPGHYVCSKCDHELFTSRSKFQHESIWPHFQETMHEDSLIKQPEPNPKDGILIKCGRCENQVGHEFVTETSSRF